MRTLSLLVYFDENIITAEFALFYFSENQIKEDDST